MPKTTKSKKKAQEQFVEVVNFHQLNSQLSSLLRLMDSPLKQLGGQPALAKAKTKKKASRKASTQKTATGRKARSAARKS